MILSKGGGMPAPGGGVPGLGHLVWGVPAPTGVPGLGGAWSRGVPGGYLPGMTTAAGSTHPTGMHSCSF